MACLSRPKSRDSFSIRVVFLFFFSIFLTKNALAQGPLPKQSLKIQSLENDPYFTHLDFADGINADKMYGYDYTGKNVNVYILDSGVDEANPEFEGRAKTFYVSPEIDRNDKTDCTGHGTHVSGIIGGKTTGIAKNANIFMLRVIGCTGEVSESAVVDALLYLEKNIVKPAVISMSLGIDPAQQTNLRNSSTLPSIFERFTKIHGIPVVISAGNSGSKICSPLTESRGAIVVGAVTTARKLTDFTNFGPCIDIYAPGESIWSLAVSNSGQKYEKLSGTSQAAPYVSAIIALLMSHNSNKQLTPKEAKEKLLAIATTTISEVTASGDQAANEKSKVAAKIALAPLSPDSIAKLNELTKTSKLKHLILPITLIILLLVFTLALAVACARRIKKKNSPKNYGIGEKSSRQIEKNLNNSKQNSSLEDSKIDLSASPTPAPKNTLRSNAPKINTSVTAPVVGPRSTSAMCAKGATSATGKKTEILMSPLSAGITLTRAPYPEAPLGAYANNNVLPGQEDSRHIMSPTSMTNASFKTAASSFSSPSGSSGANSYGGIEYQNYTMTPASLTQYLNSQQKEIVKNNVSTPAVRFAPLPVLTKIKTEIPMPIASDPVLIQPGIPKQQSSTIPNPIPKYT